MSAIITKYFHELKDEKQYFAASKNEINILQVLIHNSRTAWSSEIQYHF